MTGRVLSADVLNPSFAGGERCAAPRAWGKALADGDGRVTAPGSGELLNSPGSEPRPVPPPSSNASVSFGGPVPRPARFDNDPSDVAAGLAAPSRAVGLLSCSGSSSCEQYPRAERPDQAPAAPDSTSSPDRGPVGSWPARTSSDLPPAHPGVEASASALRERGVRLLEVESMNGIRYAGWVVTGDIEVRRWVAKGLGVISDFIFGEVG